MFYDIVNNLCKERKTTITRMAEDIGLSNAAPTSWRKGAVPKLTTLEKIAEYFDVSVDYLRGVETKKGQSIENDGLSVERKALINFAMSIPEDKVDMLLRVMKTILQDD